MRGYVVRRVVALVVTLGFVSVLVFVAIRVLPGDPVLVMAGPEANPEVVARLRAAMGLDRPLIVQYADWLGGALRGELGTSLQYDVPVGALIVSRLPVTLPLTAMAACFTLLIAMPLGVYAATRARRPGDYLTMLVAQAGLAVPSFWAGLLLILLFSVRLGWFRSGGFEGWSLGFWAAVRSLLLPAVALGLFQAAVLIRATRSSLLEVLGEEYVRTARAKGLGERAVILRHAARKQRAEGMHAHEDQRVEAHHASPEMVGRGHLHRGVAARHEEDLGEAHDGQSRRRHPEVPHR